MDRETQNLTHHSRSEGPEAAAGQAEEAAAEAGATEGGATEVMV